jgi:hypothetical protein
MAGPFDLTKSLENHKSFVRESPLERREKFYDASKQVLAQNEVVQLIQVNAGERVHRVDVEVVAIDAVAGTFDVGDGADVDGYQDGIDVAVLGFTSMELLFTEGTPNVVTGYRDGKVYAAADTIDIIALGASGLTTAKIRVVALVEKTGYGPTSF